jgi:hypothetical protein
MESKIIFYEKNLHESRFARKDTKKSPNSDFFERHWNGTFW